MEARKLEDKIESKLENKIYSVVNFILYRCISLSLIRGFFRLPCLPNSSAFRSRGVFSPLNYVVTYVLGLAGLTVSWLNLQLERLKFGEHAQNAGRVSEKQHD